MATVLSRYANILACTRQLIGDLSDAEDPCVLYYCINTALTRYSSFNERIETQCLKLLTAGCFAQSLLNWTGDIICELAYIHWPAASTVPTTTTENKITDWWYYNHGLFSTTAKETIYVDLQIEGTAVPAVDDYVLVSGVCQHRITGMDYVNYDNSDVSTYSTLPKTHDYIIALGAAAYALRVREVGPQLLLEGYISAYNMGVMAEMGERYMRDFEGELYQLSLKKLNRPAWGAPERKRMQRQLSK